MSTTSSRRTFLTRAGAVSAAAVAAPTLLSACGDSKESKEVTGGDDYEPGSADLKVEIGSEIDGVNYAEDYEGPRARELEAFGDGETEFTVLGRSIPELEYETNYYAQHLEETTGVKVKYLDVPLGEDGQTKVNAILSAGDLPHAMMTGMGLFNVSQVSVYGQQGLFIPLDKLVDEHAPHIRDMFDAFPDMRKLFTSPDGKMYAVPSMNDCYHCKTGAVRTWYNSEWLKAVDAEVPNTLDEFDSLMAKWKEFSGRPDEAPLVVTDADTMLNLMNFFLGSFLEVSESNLLAKDGKVTWIPTEDAFREGMIWIQEQFKKGHFDKAILSSTPEQVKRLGDASGGPQFGIVYGNSQGNFSGTADVTDPQNVGSIMKPLPPMEGPGGVRTCSWDWYGIGSPNFVITSSCPDPVQMIRWADYQFELGLTTSMGRGEQGTGWEYADADLEGIDGKQALYQVLPEGSDLKNQNWWEWGPFYKSMDQRHGEALMEGSTSIEPSLYDAGKAYEPYQIPKEMAIPELAFSMDESAQIGEIEANMTQHLKQSLASFGTGKTDAADDADWKAFVDTFEAMGLSTFLEIQQKAYDAQS